MAALKAGPPEIYKALEQQADVLNTPRPGNYSNVAFPALQCNIATTQSGLTEHGLYNIIPTIPYYKS